MAIEADRQLVSGLPLTARMLDSLRRTARLLSTHYSTQIEGNRLTPAQVAAVISGEGNFPGRERDEAEVKDYYRALEYVETLGGEKKAFTERVIRGIHGMVMTGQNKPTPYRDGQNAIRDNRSGTIVYLPPEAKDVKPLMRDLAAWIADSLACLEMPIPIVAALAHYQFATIHPYFDGNGRTARLLTDLILHQQGYGLNGIYSLEEYYSANLDGYYRALSVGESHNYYFGRARGDVTAFVDYFCRGMAEAFAKVRGRAEQAKREGSLDQSPRLRQLSPQQRRALGLFLRIKLVSARDVAAFFNSAPRTASALCNLWVEEGFLVVVDASKKHRRYGLARQYESLVAERANSATGEP
ncbi:MAG TPA: Fic family protein [Urbifossiella sp.]